MFGFESASWDTISSTNACELLILRDWKHRERIITTTIIISAYRKMAQFNS